MCKKPKRSFVAVAAAVGFLLPAGVGMAEEIPPLRLNVPVNAYASDGLPTSALVNSSKAVIHNLEAGCLIESIQVGTLTLQDNWVGGFRSKAVQPGESAAVSCQPPILTDATKVSGTVRVEARYVFQGKMFHNTARLVIETSEDGRMVLR
jgi:hypothetical protein